MQQFVYTTQLSEGHMSNTGDHENYRKSTAFWENLKILYNFSFSMNFGVPSWFCEWGWKCRLNLNNTFEGLLRCKIEVGEIHKYYNFNCFKHRSWSLNFQIWNMKDFISSQYSVVLLFNSNINTKQTSLEINVLSVYSHSV